MERRNISPELILHIKPRKHICPCSRTVGISKKIWIQTYCGPVAVVSVEVFRHFAFWRHGSRLATFFIAPKNCIFRGASLEPIKILATLDPEKFQGFRGAPQYHCYTLVDYCYSFQKISKFLSQKTEPYFLCKDSYIPSDIASPIFYSKFKVEYYYSVERAPTFYRQK